jgi:glycosyltransferase involved in cell wall biosynthesis
VQTSAASDMTESGSRFSFFKRDGTRLKVALVANEFFELGYSRMGGFGWAARQLARCFGADPGLGVDLVLVDAASRQAEARLEGRLHGCPILVARDTPLGFARRVWQERFDLVICIDYRRDYRRLVRLLPRTPLLVWVRDPRTPEDCARILGVRLPGAPDVVPSGLKSASATSLARVWRWSRLFGRRIVFGTPSPPLQDKVPGAYGVEGAQVDLLPNIIDLEPGVVTKSARPSVVFLARLDAYKRPWLFVELARGRPDVDFLLLGQPHFGDASNWQTDGLPPNVRWLGHVDGAEKLRLLREAWVLVNTSIHEGLAVSFLEALKCETPLLSCIDTEGVASRFGCYVGWEAGHGLGLVPAFSRELGALLDEQPRREALGRAGREWVSRVHTREGFLGAFRQLCAKAGAL